MRALLDVNVLIALRDENHTHHHIAAGWLAENIGTGWASCPITQNGCVRVLCQPQYPNTLALPDALGRLREATSMRHHLFVADDFSILDTTAIDQSAVCSAGGCVAHDLRFVTLDRAVAASAVPGGDGPLVVL